ncbi:PaaI family thioesterase [Sphingomonas sp.]|uniref:PaaI family thioesterase n=1 Tax=Sphingomonas sp. TaxID=28214 RepID=UPI001B2E25BF|nr:PaaI family thioesterase [Sphingomonas sp.]MBO9715200.1 PaaI family thioesterase [Sphingomonas sp.]
MESIFDDFPTPSSARLLGWHVRAVDVAAQTIEIGFVADERFLNPGGTVQGGFLAAMLDDTQGPALFSATQGAVYAPTIDFHVVCLKPARPGRFVGKARVVSLGKTIAVTEAELFDERGALVARGTFTGRVMEGAMARRG